MTPSIRLGTILGVRIALHPIWIFAIALIVLWIAIAGGPLTGTLLGPEARILVAPLAAALFLGSVIVHELAHVLVARRRGVEIEEVTLSIFGAAARVEREAPDARSEALIAAAGPLASIVLGLVLAAFGYAASRVVEPLGAVGAELGLGVGVLNLLLGILNLLPAFPLDGGRLLRAVLWGATGDAMQGTRMAARIGRLLGFALIGVGLALAVLVDPFAGLWAMLVGWFVYRAAEASGRRAELERIVEGVLVGDVMEREFSQVSPTLTIDTLLQQDQLESGPGLYPVVADGHLVGTIDVRQAQRVPRAKRGETRIGEVMRAGDTLSTITQPQTVLEIIGRFADGRVSAIPVVDEADPRRLLGLLTRDGLVRNLRRREALRGG